MYFINVGAGDAILVDCGDWEALLDAGPATATANSEVLATLASHVDDGIIELAILSHGHSDHYGGFGGVFARYKVQEFWRSLDTEPDTDGPTYSSFLGALTVAGLMPKLLERGDQFAIGRMRWSVLGPGELAGGATNDNENSLVLLCTFGAVSFLFPGDIEARGEASLLELDLPGGPLILKIAHHGSDTSTSLPFLKWAQPAFTIISTKYKVPPAVTNLKFMAIPFFMTSESGSICVATDGSNWTVATAGGTAHTTTTSTAPSPEGDLFLNVEPVSATGQGNDARLRASTLAGASCFITVFYKSGPSTAAGLVPQPADADGRVSWTWRVGTRTTPGTYCVEVSATLGDATTSESVWFQVLDTGSPG